MNLNTVTRKILLAARKLHLGSLTRTERKASSAYVAAYQAKRMASAAYAAAVQATSDAAAHAEAVQAACEAERRELGL